MNIETIMRNAKARDPDGFRRAIASMAADGTPTKFSTALRQKFGSGRRGKIAILRALGMDSKPEGFDTAPIKKFLLARGISEDDTETFLKMLPSDWSDDHEQFAQHGHGRDDAEEQEERQRRLENAERETAPRHERDDMRAREIEHRDSRQSEDNLRANRVHGGKGGRWAHDENFLRVGTSMSAGGMPRHERVPVACDAARLKRLDEKFGIDCIGGV